MGAQLGRSHGQVRDITQKLTQLPRMGDGGLTRGRLGEREG
jgi:hypothetical protein